MFEDSDQRGVDAQQVPKIERLLDRLDTALQPEDMNIPGFGFHQLKGERKGTYAVTVVKNWRITFEFDGDNAINVNLEDYH